MQETQVGSLGQEDHLEKEMATHFSILAWEIPCTEKPGRLQSMRSQRVGHDWVTNIFTFVLIRTVRSLLLFSRSVMSDSLWPHGLQHTRLPYPTLSPRVWPSSCPLNWWCHSTISSSVSPFSSHPQSRSFPVSQLFTSGGQSVGTSALALVLPRISIILKVSEVKSLSRVWLSAAPWTAAYQAPPSVGFSRREYWSGVPLPSP